MHPYYFCLPTKASPTYFNLQQYLLQQGWCETSEDSKAHLSERHFQLNAHVTELLEYKHRLAKFVHQLNLDVMPLTYTINDFNCFEVIAHIAESKPLRELTWILKPALLNNGQHIMIFPHVEDIEKHYLDPHRLGGEHVLQQYLDSPHLLNEHKYSIRMFSILTNDVGNYLYPYGYLNVARQLYQPTHFTDLRPHLTNEHLCEEESNVMQVPTKPIPGFAYIYQQIKTILSSLSMGLCALYPDVFRQGSTRTLAIFGFDFLVDSDLRVWLLEANHGPCFPHDSAHPLQKPLYTDFWQAFITSFIVPIAKQTPTKNIQYQSFESL
jgi:hypothetical protein